MLDRERLPCHGIPLAHSASVHCSVLRKNMAGQYGSGTSGSTGNIFPAVPGPRSIGSRRHQDAGRAVCRTGPGTQPAVNARCRIDHREQMSQLPLLHLDARLRAYGRTQRTARAVLIFADLLHTISSSLPASPSSPSASCPWNPFQSGPERQSTRKSRCIQQIPNTGQGKSTTSPR